MRGSRQRSAAALGVSVLALLLFVVPSTETQAAPVLGGQLFSTGAPVEIEVLSASAALTSTLFLLEPQEVRIATNRDVGTKVTIGPYAAREELIFGIRVSGQEYRMGPASRKKILGRATVSVRGTAAVYRSELAPGQSKTRSTRWSVTGFARA